MLCFKGQMNYSAYIMKSHHQVTDSADHSDLLSSEGGRIYLEAVVHHSPLLRTGGSAPHAQ